MNKDKMKWSERLGEEERSFRSRVGGKWKEVAEVGWQFEKQPPRFLGGGFLRDVTNPACSSPIQKGGSLGMSTLRQFENKKGVCSNRDDLNCETSTG